MLGIHEAVFSDIGLGIGERLLGAEQGPGTGAPYRYLTSGSSLELDAV